MPTNTSFIEQDNRTVTESGIDPLYHINGIFTLTLCAVIIKTMSYDNPLSQVPQPPSVTPSVPQLPTLKHPNPILPGTPLDKIHTESIALYTG